VEEWELLISLEIAVFVWRLEPWKILLVLLETLYLAMANDKRARGLGSGVSLLV